MKQYFLIFLLLFGVYAVGGLQAAGITAIFIVAGYLFHWLLQQ